MENDITFNVGSFVPETAMEQYTDKIIILRAITIKKLIITQCCILTLLNVTWHLDSKPEPLMKPGAVKNDIPAHPLQTATIFD